MNNALSALASQPSLATPVYFYDMDLLDRTINAIRQAIPSDSFHVHYALKANVEPLILSRIAQAGFGADSVSGGEIRMALDAGFRPADIVYAGVGKTDAEIDLGISLEIGCFNAESVEELAVIAERARLAAKKVSVALRVNPDIDAHTHHYITTGLAENKFGISMERLESALQLVTRSEWLSLKGLHFHIGSQITTMEPYRILCERINSLQHHYASKGILFDSINVGGGLGIDYEHPDAEPIPDFAAYFNVFDRYLELRPGQELHFELGRSIVAQCGSLVSRVLYMKHGLEKDFVILDAGFTDLIRPALYGAHHLIENISSRSDRKAVYDVVGPICESSDTFGEKIELPETQRGDLIAIRSAGAYGSVMAMQYNGRQLPGAIFG